MKGNKSRKKLKRQAQLKERKKALKELKGKVCNLCGDCCRGFSLPAHNLSTDYKTYLSYHENVEIRIYEGKPIIYFNNVCKHLTEDNKCAIYETRPQICKDGYTVKRTGVMFPENCSLK